MKYISLVLLCLIAKSAVFAQPANDRQGAPQAVVVRNGDIWTVTYNLDRDETAWGFVRSNLLRETMTSWRVDHWQVLTPGVQLARSQGRDLLIADNGFVPRKVTMRFPIETRDLLADYDPALKFSSGAVALYSGHFALAPARPKTGEVLELPDPTIRFTDTSGILWAADGRQSNTQLIRKPRYQLFGEDTPIEDEHSALLLDKALPAWIRAQLTDFTPEVITAYRQRLGMPTLSGKPQLWATWGGTGKQGYSFSGSVLPGHIVMALSGSELVQPSPDILAGAQWFIAHEAAHFWLGETLGYAEQGDAWFTEGGANMAALTLLSEFDPGFNRNKEVHDYVQRCRKDAQSGSIKTAQKRQSFDIYYSCGAIFHMVAGKLAGQSGSDWFSFTHGLIQQYGQKPDSKMSTHLWLAAVEKLGANQAIITAMRTIQNGNRASERGDAVETLLNFLALTSVDRPKPSKQETI